MAIEIGIFRFLVRTSASAAFLATFFFCAFSLTFVGK